MKKHIYIVILLAACLGSCGNKYYEFSDAEEYMLPYEANDSVQYCANTDYGYLTVTSYRRYVSDDGYFLPATHSYDIKYIRFENFDNEDFISWQQRKEDNNFTIDISTRFNQHSNEFHNYYFDASNQIFYERFVIKNRAFANVYELKNYSDSFKNFYYNSEQGFLMLTHESDTIFFGETLN